jgi:hypothetical protein
MKMHQTFPAAARLNSLKGTHKPLIHPPSGFCRKAEAFFCTPRFTSDTHPVQIARIRTAVMSGGQLMRAASGRLPAVQLNLMPKR